MRLFLGGFGDCVGFVGKGREVPFDGREACVGRCGMCVLIKHYFRDSAGEKDDEADSARQNPHKRIEAAFKLALLDFHVRHRFGVFVGPFPFVGAEILELFNEIVDPIVGLFRHR